MEVTSSHTRNPALGWDISASAKAGKGEKIARARIIVNDFPEYDESFDPPISSWKEQLPQQGQYPGDNKVRVVITDEDSDDTESLDAWSV
jgi:hypothetical protein